MITRVAAPPDKPLLLFDGDCGFCRAWLGRWRDLTGDRVEYRPFQDPSVAQAFPEIPRDRFEKAVHFIETDGAVYAAAEAVLRALTYAPGRKWLFRAYEYIPFVEPVSELIYGVIARHRPAASVVTRIAWGRELGPTYAWAAWLFLRLLGIIFLIAFASFWTQAAGLIGSRGIVAVGDSIDAFLVWMAQAGIGLDRFRWFPTVFWLNTSDAFLHTVCGGGVLLSLLLIAGVAPAATLSLLWLGYLSLAVVAGEFLSFQWDVLLLEMSVLAIVLAPPQWLSRRVAPTLAGLWLFRFLLFRLMFSSGFVKLASGDPNWRNLTALTFHYETQPLPTWIGWYAHQLPAAIHMVSTAIMLAIELVVPFLLFAPRRLRMIAGAIFVALYVLIGVTGNYGFFGLQMLALCLLLFDDVTLRRLPWIRGFRLEAEDLPAKARSHKPRRWPRWALVPAVVVLATTAIAEMMATVGAPLDAIPPIGGVRAFIAPLRTVNRYGLFAIMTTSRPEVVVEGSRDGVTWLAYDFRHKPDDPSQRPGFVAPHQPRLDWQMWFAALGRCQDNQWLVNFTVRLLEGSPDVRRLLARDPFGGDAPRHIRTVVYDYRFTDRDTKRTLGTWWRREEKGSYCPALSK